MKKMLVLALVLGIASLASATVTVSVSSNTVAVGGTVTVSVSSDNTDGYVKYLDMVKGTATLGTVSKLPAAGAQADVIDYSTGTLYDIGLTAADFTNTPTAGIHFTVLATATGNVGDTFTLDLLNDQTFDVASTQTVTIIPEPVTMALLGIGGLFLRRRK